MNKIMAIHKSIYLDSCSGGGVLIPIAMWRPRTKPPRSFIIPVNPEPMITKHLPTKQ